MDYQIREIRENEYPILADFWDSMRTGQQKVTILFGGWLYAYVIFNESRAIAIVC